MTTKTLSKPLTAILLTLSGTTALAQQRGQPIEIGESNLFPSAEIRFISDSNAFLTPDDETDTTGVVVSPRVEWLAQRRLLDLSLVYQGDYAAYSEDTLDFDDHLLSFTAAAELSARQRVRGSVAVSRAHEPLGTDLTRGIADENTEQVESTNLDAQASFVYGANNAKGNLELGLRVADQNFTNQDEITDGRSFTEFEPFAVFSLRLSSDTRLLFEGSISDQSFDEEIRDRTDSTVLVGISLGENRKTSGTARIGYTQASFEQDTRGDEDAFVADIALRWEPADFSAFELTASREFDNSEADAVQSLTLDDFVRLRWSHDWSSRVSTDTFVSRRGSDRDCPDLDTTTLTAGVQIAFSVRRWLVLGAGVDASSRSSDSCPVPDPDFNDLDFDRQTGSIFLRATL